MKPKLSASYGLKLKTLAFLALALINASKAFSQPPPPNYDPLRDIDSQLRVFFSPLCVPDTGRFLYEMSSHVVGEGYFTDNSTDTLINDTWYKLYEEFRKMAYDTTWLLRHDTIYNRSTNFGKDTIVMDMMCYNFYTLHDSALVTDTFFNFDTTNYTISDKFPCELYPYINNRVFASCPTDYYLPYKEVTYRIDENFIFHDQWNDFAANNWMLEIDFGDGGGWQSYPIIAGGMPHHYDAIYPTSGSAYIHTRVLDPMTGMYIMSSYSEVLVPNRSKPLQPSWKKSLPGVDIGVYDPCEESGEPLKKVIIVVEGYDPANNFPNFTPGQTGGLRGNRSTPEIYQSMIANPGIDELRNFGYTFVVIDWHDSRIDMALNAHALKGVINWLKCEQAMNADVGTHEQFVIIAESMGGLVSRLAMCDMEQNWPSLNGCLDNKMHNTRLLITYDSPHAGVNIPLAFQHLYRDAGKFLLGSSTITQAIAGGMTNFLLDSKSVKQMLLYHVDAKHLPTDEYFEHPDRTAFRAGLSALGNYPQYCKMLAMSNGSLQGNGQTDVLNGDPRMPNDRFMDWDTDVFARIFGTEIQLFGTNMELRTSPNGSGNLTVSNTDFYRPQIRFNVTVTPRWPWPPRIRVNMNVNSTYWFSKGITHHANNMEPYDVIPGSTEDFNNQVFQNNPNGGLGLTKGAINIFFGSSSPNFNQGTGTWTFTKAGGGIGRGNNGTRGLVSASFASEGLHFCFVPVFSALDYNLGSNYWLDIEAENIATKVGANPFDVITGILDEDVNDNVYRFSQTHTFVRRDRLGSWYNGNPASNFVSYDSCQDNPHPGNVRFLNREIGDDTLWLNNRVAAWTCLYDAEKYIGVDEQNPYYEHPTSTNNTVHTIPGIYSKESGYSSVNGTTIFMVRTNPLNTVFTNGTPTYPFIRDTINWIKCCGDVQQLKPGRLPSESYKNQQLPTYNIDNTGFNVYPNPLLENVVNIEFSNKGGVSSQIFLYDIMGRKVLEDDINSSSEKFVKYKMNVDRSKISNGTYLIVVKTGSNLFRQTIVIK